MKVKYIKIISEEWENIKGYIVVEFLHKLTTHYRKLNIDSNETVKKLKSYVIIPRAITNKL